MHISLVDFVGEDARPQYRLVGLYEASQLLRELKWNAWDDRGRVYRGGGFNPDAVGVVTTGSGRRSANTSNYYTLMMNGLPSWRDYPAREFVASMSLDKASSYGNTVCEVVGGVWGLCPTTDVWQSFDVAGIEAFGIEVIHNSLGALNDIWKDVGVSDSSLTAMIRDLVEESDGKNSRALSVLDDGVSMSTALSRWFAPEKHGFRLLKYDDLPRLNEPGSYHECWTGPGRELVMIPRRVHLKMLDRVPASDWTKESQSVVDEFYEEFYKEN